MAKKKPIARSRAKKFPKGVEEGLRHDLASEKRGRPGAAAKVADHWGLTVKEVKKFASNWKPEIDDLRGKVSEGCFILAGRMAGELSKAMLDEKKMADTPIRDMAQSIEKLTNAGVTAADGHKPLINIDFGNLLERKQRMERIDLAAKRLKGREVA